MAFKHILFFFVLAPFVSCRFARKKAKVTRETLFDSITDEAKEALAAIGQLPKNVQEEPLNVTLVMQLSILSGSVDNVAWLLTEMNSTRALGLGLKFPPELSERALRTTDKRATDGDVVALFGLATAALDPSRAQKLADVFIFGAFGAPFMDRVCTTEEPAVFDEEGVPDCHIQIILDFIRDRMIGAFEDTEDMQRILASDPDVSVNGLNGAELSQLDVFVSSWPCAYCFEDVFCTTHATNCPIDSGIAPGPAPDAGMESDFLQLVLADPSISSLDNIDLEDLVEDGI